MMHRRAELVHDDARCASTTDLSAISQPIPIFIGITGKRDLADDTEARRRLAAVLDYLDAQLPKTPKVLLTGGAVGADTIAAQVVLETEQDGTAKRPHWLVAVVLPFELALFYEDFQQDEERRALEDLLRNDRVRKHVLPPLRLPDGKLAQSYHLTRQNPAEPAADLRRRHYEQVGLWIADTANLVVAVMAREETAQRTGGTARIVACLRCGRPDSVAGQVIAASTALAPRPELLRPSARYCWLVDVTAPRPAAALPIALLPPLDDPQEAYARPGIGPDMGARDFRSHVERSLSFAKAANRYAGWGACGEAHWPTFADPVEALTPARRTLDRPLKAATELSRRTFVALALLFVLAVPAFELFVKFPDNPVPLSVYLLLLVSIIATFLVAHWRKWQPIAEDYRAVSEMLRLQRVFWQSGLDLRVDHIHLHGADPDLVRIRDAARNVITWAILSSEAREPPTQWRKIWDPAHALPPVRPATAAACAGGWIKNQLRYFWVREHEREKAVHRVSVLSWTFFVASGWLAALVLLGMWPPLPARLDKVLHLVGGAGRGVMVLLATACILLIAILCWVRVQWREPLRRGATVALTAIFGLGVALAAVGAIVAVAPAMSPHAPGSAAKSTSIIVIVLLPAAAGAMRFVAEKLAYEPEALRYRDALGWFTRAEQLFREIRPGTGDAAADAQARALIEALGRLALRENEAWLSSRRERPVTPVIGG